MNRQIPGFVSEASFARSVGLTVWGIRAWKKRGYGPQPVKLGKAVFYPEASVTAFMSQLLGQSQE